MGHARSETFLKHYISSSVVVDVQATFLGQDSKSDLIKEMGKLALRRDPNIPKGLTDVQKQEAHQAPELQDAETNWRSLGHQLKQQYGQINKVPKECPLAAERHELKKKVNKLKLRYEREAFDKLLNTFHSNADLEAMVAQLKGERLPTTAALAPIEHSLPQRNELATSLFKPAEDDITFSRIVEAMTQLCCACETKPSRNYSRNSIPLKGSVQSPSKQIDVQMQDLPLITENPSVQRLKSPKQSPVDSPRLWRITIPAPRVNRPAHKVLTARQRTSKPMPTCDSSKNRLATQAQSSSTLGTRTCLFCHTRFRRKDCLRRHYRTRHFQYQVGPFSCPVPSCKKIINDADHFSNHAVAFHKSDLGVRASIMSTTTRNAKPGQLATFTL